MTTNGSGAEQATAAEIDLALVRRVQAGDKNAFDLLVSRYEHRIIKLVGRFVNDSAEVHDVAQEAFIKAYRALPRFRGDSAFYTWLYRIAVNSAKNYLVAKGRRPPRSDVDVTDGVVDETGFELADIATPEALSVTAELKEAIDSAFSELPEDLRTTLALCEFEGMSYEQIAVVVDCPIGTVRSRIFRARKALEVKLAPLLD